MFIKSWIAVAIQGLMYIKIAIEIIQHAEGKLAIFDTKILWFWTWFIMTNHFNCIYVSWCDYLSKHDLVKHFN